MFTLFVILTILTSLLLIGVVLIQKSKGGGLSSSFAGSNQIMGVRRTNNFIEKVTWGLAGAIAVFAILSSYTMPSGAIHSTPRVQAAAPAPVAGANFDGGEASAPVAPAAPAAAETPAPAAPAAPATPAAE